MDIPATAETNLPKNRFGAAKIMENPEEKVSFDD